MRTNEDEIDNATGPSDCIVSTDSLAVFKGVHICPISEKYRI